MKRLLFALMILFYSGISAQEIRKKISGIQTIQEAQDFIQKHPTLSGEVYPIYPSTDTGTINFRMAQEKKGKIVEYQGFYYKILQDTLKNFSKVSYIYLSGAHYSRKQIDSIRAIILLQLRKGTPFEQLASEYTMDGNSTGYLDWFPDGMMVKPFEDEVKKHVRDEIFLVDVPELRWYYVVKKIEDTKLLRELVVLKLKLNN